MAPKPRLRSRARPVNRICLTASTPWPARRPPPASCTPPCAPCRYRSDGRRTSRPRSSDKTDNTHSSSIPSPWSRRWAASSGLQSLGVPYGSLPRLVLIHIMTEAVRTKSRHIVLGATFTDWMRRMGFRTISYGPRGSATLIREQLDRLLACEWMIRWESDDRAGRARVWD